MSKDRKVPSKHELHEIGDWPKKPADALSVVGSIVGGDQTHWSNHQWILNQLKNMGLVSFDSSVGVSGRQVNALHVHHVQLITEAALFLQGKGITYAKSTPRVRATALNEFVQFGQRQQEIGK